MKIFQKCITNQIYTIHFWPLEKLVETFEKKFRRETLKNDVFRKSILTPQPSRTPLGVLPCPLMCILLAFLQIQSNFIKFNVLYEKLCVHQSLSIDEIIKGFLPIGLDKV